MTAYFPGGLSRNLICFENMNGNENPVLHITSIDNQYLKTTMANSHVSYFSLAIVLLITTKYVSSGKCDSFEDVAVMLTDINGGKFNETLNGCIEGKELNYRPVGTAYFRKQKVPVLGEDSVRNMDQLSSIYFWGCELDVVKPFAFRNVPKLELVFITNCSLKEIPKDVFNVIPNLRILSFDENKVDIDNKAFVNLTSLKTVYGTRNNLEYWYREWFDDNINLELIDFHYNKIRTIPRKAFATLGRLKNIDFSYNEISTIQPDAFKGLRNLQYLGLHGNRLTVINENIFPNDVRIEALYLGKNHLNFLSNEVLKKISVKTINLYYNPWKCPCLDRIHYWLFSINGTLRGSYTWNNGPLSKGDNKCERSKIPVCAYSKSYSQTCLEYVDNELTQRYLDTLRGIDEPWLKGCASL